MLTRLTDRTFHRAIQSSQPILVTFTAPVRCVHCREQKPALEAMEENYPGRVFVLDVEQPDSAQIEATLGGRGVPFTKVYANGQLLNEHLGKMQLGEIVGIFKEGSELAAQMGTHRPSTPAPPQMAAMAAVSDDDQALEAVEETVATRAPRRSGHRTLKGLLAGFGRE